jgi:UDP:flavonoid glycosyltransferase YjiC (YdhE family)
MSASYAERLAAIQGANRSDLALLLKPRLLQMPLPMQRFDDPFLPFMKAIIGATRELVCAYVFDLATFMATGAAGMVALERSIAYAGGDVMKILHVPFASDDYVTAVSESAFNVDAVTIVDEQFLRAYTADSTRAAYMIRRGENPVIVPYPPNAGVYWQDVNLFTLIDADGRNLRLRLADESVLYAGRGDDFAERVRAALEGMR